MQTLANIAIPIAHRPNQQNRTNHSVLEPHPRVKSFESKRAAVGKQALPELENIKFASAGKRVRRAPGRGQSLEFECKRSRCPAARFSLIHSPVRFPRIIHFRSHPSWREGQRERPRGHSLSTSLLRPSRCAAWFIVPNCWCFIAPEQFSFHLCVFRHFSSSIVCLGISLYYCARALCNDVYRPVGCGARESAWTGPINQSVSLVSPIYFCGVYFCVLLYHS